MPWKARTVGRLGDGVDAPDGVDVLRRHGHHLVRADEVELFEVGEEDEGDVEGHAIAPQPRGTDVSQQPRLPNSETLTKGNEW